jgi:hypothetical protein
MMDQTGLYLIKLLPVVEQCQQYLGIPIMCLHHQVLLSLPLVLKLAKHFLLLVVVVVGIKLAVVAVLVD